MREPSIVVVSFNTRRYLERCLGAVDGRGHEVVVVDNASTDGSAQLVREVPGGAADRAHPERGLRGRARTAGSRRRRGATACVMNEDAWPDDDEAIARLVACAERHPRAGILGPRLLAEDGRTQVSVVGMPTRWWTGAPAVSSAPPRRFGRVALCPRGRKGRFLVGAVLLMRREAIDEVGGFDPAFFMFGDEVDLCRRMQRAGWRVELCAEAVFVHVGGAATQRDWPMYYREQVRGHLRQLAKYEGRTARSRLAGSCGSPCACAPWSGPARHGPCTARPLAGLGRTTCRPCWRRRVVLVRIVRRQRRIEPAVTAVEGRRKRDRQDRPLRPVLASPRLDLVEVVVDLGAWHPRRVTFALVTNLELDQEGRVVAELADCPQVGDFRRQ